MGVAVHKSLRHYLDSRYRHNHNHHHHQNNNHHHHHFKEKDVNFAILGTGDCSPLNVCRDAW